MKLYQVRGKLGKLKYSDEHIHFKLDGSLEYNWRIVLDEICRLSELNIPKNLDFETDKINFKDLNDYDWLKSGFLLPILSNRLLDFIKKQIHESFEVFPVRIMNKKNEKETNENFSAFYLKETFDCLDLLNTKKIILNRKEQYDFQNGLYKENIEYPIIFKIREMKLLNTHYCTEKGKNALMNFSENGFDFFELTKVNMT